MQSRIGVGKWFLRIVLIAVPLLALAVTLAAAPSGKDDKAAAAQMVDSGSFGVFINGRRVATETFSIHQNSGGSSVVSEFKSEAGMDKADQTSDWQMAANSELRKYEWKEVSPGQSQAVVVPNQDFLIERYRNNPQEKELEKPFLIPASSSVLDDYFFVQREVLAWKYLATTCKQNKGALQCPLKQPVPFGALNPHARSPVSVTLEFAGREKVSIRGANQELNRLDLKSESQNWTLWMDDQFKLQRILIVGDNTEVVRD
jgi:hypothetical protein